MENKVASNEDRLAKVKAQVEAFLTDTDDARALSERDRDYVDHKQWTDEQIEKLKKRGQAAIVVNRIKPKVEGLKGLVSVRKSDPKAYPRTKKHEKASEAATDALRFVADSNDFSNIKMEVADNFFVEGYAGAIVDVKQNGAGEVDVRIEEIPWDRIYFDPHSRKKDFSDARFIGMIVWMDEDQAREMFPDADIDALLSSSKNAYDTFEDRPRWLSRSDRRIRIALHFYIEGGKWMMCTFTEDLFLVDPQESPFLDEFAVPCCPIELVSAYIDRNNNRYGEVRGFIDQQDEINHRRSKALHLLSQRQTKAPRGTFDKDFSVKDMKRELAKPDGHVEYAITGDQGFEILQTGDMAQGQFQLYQDAKAELDAVSFNAQLAGERQSGDLSGKAIDKLQQAGTVELNGLFTALNGWEKRIYRQAWARIKQFWTEEKWIRVTDDQDSLRWVGLNSQITAQEFLEETINDDSKPLTERRKAAAALQALMQTNDERLNEVVGVRNETAQLDVDIILDQSFDTINIQQEQFQLLAQFGQGSDIDIIELIELSQLRGKEELIEKIEARRKAATEAAGNVQQVQGKMVEAKVFETLSKAENNKQDAIQKQIQNQIMIARPPVTVDINT